MVTKKIKLLHHFLVFSHYLCLPVVLDTSIVFTKVTRSKSLCLIENIVPTKFKNYTKYQRNLSSLSENIAKTKCLIGQFTGVVVLGLKVVRFANQYLFLATFYSIGDLNAMF